MTPHETATLLSDLATALSALIVAVPSMDLTPVARRKWEFTLETVDESLNDLRCACGRPIACLHDTEFVCQACADKLVEGGCCGCGLPLLVAEAVGEHSEYHETCVGARAGEA